jgi:hypothetical protein
LIIGTCYGCVAAGGDPSLEPEHDGAAPDAISVDDDATSSVDDSGSPVEETGGSAGDDASASDSGTPPVDATVTADASGGGGPGGSPGGGSTGGGSDSGAAKDSGSVAIDSGAAKDSGSVAIDSGSGKDSGVVDASKPPSTSGASLLLAEAMRELTSMKSSTYQHTTSVDEATGVYDYDCSGFLGYALDHSVPSAIASIRAASSSRPLAKDFEDYFASISSGSKGGWTQVAHVPDLGPGDVIAWLEPAGTATTNTGHVMIVRAAPTASSTKGEWLVLVIDSANSGHGPLDTRVATGASGLGSGTVGLFVDASGAPIAFRWSGGVSSSVEKATSISLGHIL